MFGIPVFGLLHKPPSFSMPLRNFARRAVDLRRNDEGNVSRAVAKPTMAGRFSVPALIPCSCPPPSIRGEMETPSRMYRNPAPLGP